MIRVYVGVEGRLFTLPKDLLYSVSPYFRKGQKTSSEGITELRLPSVGNKEFESFI